MAVIIFILILFIGVWADHSPVNTQEYRSEIHPMEVIRSTPIIVEGQQHVDSEKPIKKDVLENNDSECDFPFERVGYKCYFFSKEQKTFDEAVNYCESLEHGHIYDITLAMLDYSIDEDQALLEAITNKNNMYWVGGQTEDGVNWNWLDHREIYIPASFWYYGEPNQPQNKCLIAQVKEFGNNRRSYLHDYSCDESLNFICQAGFPLNFEFQRIGNNYYFSSEELGLGHAIWQDARDFCQSLVVPVGYHSDLAVLGMATQDDYHLMGKLVAGHQGTIWIGALAETDCDYKWVDGRPLSSSAVYWVYDEPDCGSQNRGVLWQDSSNNRTYLSDITETSSRPFICQMFKDI